MTNKALIISMVLHVILIITLFYFKVSEKELLILNDSMDVSITTIPKQPQTKIKSPEPQQRKTTVFDVTRKPESRVESIKPNITIKQRLDHTTHIITEEPRLEDTKTAPDINVNVSTDFRALKQIDGGISTVESATSTVGNSLGSKRSGTFGIQRTPTRSNLDIAGQIGGVGNEITDIGGLEEEKPEEPIETFSNVLKSLGEEIAETSDGGPIDVVFVIDASGSMGDNINAVAAHLSEMIDVYESSNIDYELGLSKFNTNGKENNIEVHQLTKNLNEYKQKINAVMIGNNENALDAVEKTVIDMKFRPTSQKHLILVTDEPFTSIEGNTVRGTIDLCREFGIFVNVLGLPDDEHQLIAIRTDGKWHSIPGDVRKRPLSKPKLTATANQKMNHLKNAKWSELHRIGKVVLSSTESTPVDIVLFIDGSDSMEDKVSALLTQIEYWFRNWDNSLIDYQVGVVRFRMRGSVNMVNVYNPPQTLEQTRAIIELPCKLNEDLIHAINQGMRKIKLRPEAQTHLIIVTDEPLGTNMSYEGIIQFLVQKNVIVSVVGTYDGFLQGVTKKTGGTWVPIPNGNMVNQPYW